MSVQPEPVSNKDSAGPGLSGLPAVNQSPSATAQTQHGPHDPYPNAYPVYHEGVPFSNSYNSNISLNSAYYPHPHSPVNVSQQEQRDRHAQGQHAFHSEQQSRQVQAGTQRQAPMHALSQPEGPAQSHVPPSSQHAQQAQPSPIGPPPLHDTSFDLSTSQSTTASSPPAAKRQQDVAAPPEDEGPPAKRQKHHTSMSQMSFEGDGEVKDEGEVGPGGGAKHWTDEEKSKLFHWTLDDDDRWKAFGEKMNTVFREGSTQVFNGRKTFTALKSCYHRNVEVFKQIYAFEGFLARAPFMPLPARPDVSSAPSSSTNSLSFPEDANEMAKMPTPITFVAAAQRHAFLERKLEAARALNVPVGNLTVKVIDHWCEMGWYLLFKKRFKEDPSTGLPVPRYPSTDIIDDPDADAEGEDAATSDQDSHNAETRPSEARRRHLNSTDSIIPPPLPNQGPVTPSVSRVHRASSPRHTIVNQTPGPSHHPIVGPSSPQVPYGYPPPPPISYYGSPPIPPDYYVQQHHFQQQQLHFQAQTAQTLSHLTNLTQTLLGTCSTLVDLMRAQMEDGRVLLEIVRRREEREENNSRPASRENGTSSGSGGGDSQSTLGQNNKAALATEVLSNPNVSDEVRQAATDYLKKIFQ